MGPLEYEIIDFEDPPPDLPFMVPVESLLVASRTDGGRLAGLFEQVDCVLLSLRGSVAVRGQHCFSSVGQEEGCEPYGSFWGRSQALEDRWDLYNSSPDILVESVEDA